MLQLNTVGFLSNFKVNCFSFKTVQFANIEKS